MQPTLPIVAYDGSDMMIFSSTDEALSYIEPVDIESFEVSFFDSEGDPLSAVRVKGQYIALEKMGRTIGTEVLAGVVRSFLLRVLPEARFTEEDIGGASLDKLLEIAREFAFIR